MACGGCAKRRQALKDAWHRIKGNTMRTDSVLLSKNRRAHAELEAQAQAERERRGPGWLRQMIRPQG